MTARWTDSGYNPIADFQPRQFDHFDDLPALPVLLETLLLLELEAQERSIDLRRVTELVLSDLGATLQIMRLAAREQACAEFRLSRIEDCIADLGFDLCLQSLLANTVSRAAGQNAITETWAHAKEIAVYSRQIAEERQDVDPGEAYLAGLLHAIGILPAVLGWASGKYGVSDFELAGFKLANTWSLAPFLVNFLGEVSDETCTSPLPQIVREAHLRADRSVIQCPLDQRLGPFLFRTA
ncbi:MAG: HDOD domain-containing protein [Terracidiphilus sp.]|jgi:hypothetical protein